MRHHTILVLTATSLLLALATAQKAVLHCGHDNCFELLGLKRNASRADIRKAFRQLSITKHPDKNPDDPNAIENFRKISAAHEALSDEGNRAKYEDYLDNPYKYPEILMSLSREVYAPKSNVLLVVSGLVGIATLIHWLNMNNTYKQTLRRMRESQEYKRQVARLLKTKQASTREEAEAMLNIDVVGLEEPDWRKLVVFKIAFLPIKAGKALAWHARWLFNYKIRKIEFSDDDKLYLIQKNMGVSDDDWKNISENDRETFVKEELWDKEKYAEFERIKRIEMNRLGKTKKKKRHTPMPYSEAEDVVMGE